MRPTRRPVRRDELVDADAPERRIRPTLNPAPGNRRTMDFPGPKRGQDWTIRYPPGAHEVGEYPRDIYDMTANMGNLRTLPTKGQFAMANAELGVQGGGAQSDLDWITQDAYEALLRKMHHLSVMPHLPPEWSGQRPPSPSHIPPVANRPFLGPMSGTGPTFDPAQHSYRELLDELHARRAGRAMIGAMEQGILGGGPDMGGDWGRA
jgi:hypothetical protein